MHTTVSQIYAVNSPDSINLSKRMIYIPNEVTGEKAQALHGFYSFKRATDGSIYGKHPFY